MVAAQAVGGVGGDLTINAPGTTLAGSLMLSADRDIHINAAFFRDQATAGETITFKPGGAVDKDFGALRYAGRDLVIDVTAGGTQDHDLTLTGVGATYVAANNLELIGQNITLSGAGSADLIFKAGGSDLKLTGSVMGPSGTISPASGVQLIGYGKDTDVIFQDDTSGYGPPSSVTPPTIDIGANGGLDADGNPIPTISTTGYLQLRALTAKVDAGALVYSGNTEANCSPSHSSTPCGGLIVTADLFTVDGTVKSFGDFSNQPGLDAVSNQTLRIDAGGYLYSNTINVDYGAIQLNAGATAADTATLAGGASAITLASLQETASPYNRLMLSMTDAETGHPTASNLTINSTTDFTNYGLIYGFGDLTVQLGAVYSLTNAPGAAIGTRDGDLSISAASISNSSGALIYGGRNLSLSANAATGWVWAWLTKV